MSVVVRYYAPSTSTTVTCSADAAPGIALSVWHAAARRGLSVTPLAGLGPGAAAGAPPAREPRAWAWVAAHSLSFGAADGAPAAHLQTLAGASDVGRGSRARPWRDRGESPRAERRMGILLLKGARPASKPRRDNLKGEGYGATRETRAVTGVCVRVTKRPRPGPARPIRLTIRSNVGFGTLGVFRCILESASEWDQCPWGEVHFSSESLSARIPPPALRQTRMPP
jgi:hypothetical protein